MNKKFWTIIFATIILVTGVFLYAGGFLNKKNNNEVVFWTLQMSDFAPYINGVIKEFETQNPQIKIKWVDVPFSEGEKRTLASVLSDNPPDLVNLNPDFSATLAQKGALYEIPKSKTLQYNPSIMDALTYKGKIYSIPWYATSAITIYNKKLLGKAGIALPKTYDETSSAAQKVKSNTGAYIFIPNITENDTFLKILNKYGVSDFDTINTAKSVKVFAMFKNLYDTGLIPKETITITLQEALEKYMAEKALYIGAGANFLNMIKENAPSVYNDTDVAPQITGETGQYDFSLMNFVIPQRAKHKTEALEFALFLTNEKNQLSLAKQANILAVNQKTLENEFYTKYETGNLPAKARVISAKQLNNIKPVYKTKRNQKEINNIINSALQKILSEKTDIKSVLDNAAKDWKAVEND